MVQKVCFLNSQGKTKQKMSKTITISFSVDKDNVSVEKPPAVIESQTIDLSQLSDAVDISNAQSVIQQKLGEVRKLHDGVYQMTSFSISNQDVTNDTVVILWKYTSDTGRSFYDHEVKHVFRVAGNTLLEESNEELSCEGGRYDF